MAWMVLGSLNVGIHCTFFFPLPEDCHHTLKGKSKLSMAFKLLLAVETDQDDDIDASCWFRTLMLKTSLRNVRNLRVFLAADTNVYSILCFAM